MRSENRPAARARAASRRRTGPRTRLDSVGSEPRPGSSVTPAAREEDGAHQVPRASGPQADAGPGSRPMPMLKRCRNATGSAAKSRPRPIAPVRRSSPTNSTLLAPIRCSTSPFESRDPVRRARLNRHEPECARPRRVRPPDRGGERRPAAAPGPAALSDSSSPRLAAKGPLPPGRRRRGRGRGRSSSSPSRIHAALRRR